MWLLTLFAVAGVHLQCQSATLDYHTYNYGQPSYGTSLQGYGSYYGSDPYTNSGYSSYYADYAGDSYVSRMRCRRYTCPTNSNHPCCYPSPAPPPVSVSCPPPCPTIAPCNPAVCPTTAPVACTTSCPPPPPVTCPPPCPPPPPVTCNPPCPPPPQVTCNPPCPPPPSVTCNPPCPPPPSVACPASCPAVAPVPAPCSSGCQVPVPSPGIAAACPAQAAACPYGSRGRRRRNTQRKCHLNAHCPSDSACCNDDCGFGSVCKRTSSAYNYTSTALESLSYANKVDVTVIITSGSFHSAWFVQTQLKPVLEYLHPYINTEVVAYGILRQDGECKYGASDCFGNRLIGCSAKYIREQTAIVNFTACFMEHNSALQGSSLQNVLVVARQCIDQSASTSPLWHYIRDCAWGTEGYALFHAAGERQRAVVGQIQQLPAIALNGVLSLTQSTELGYFSYMVCEMLKSNPQVQTTCQRVFGHA